MKTVLFIHQSAEMYGSDKVLLDIVVRLDKEKFHPIVYLPEDGPLATALKDAGIDVVFGVVCKLSRASFSTRGTFLFIKQLIQAYKAISKISHDNKLDIVHSNTLAVFGGGVWARLNRVPHIWHVHEIC